MISNIFSSFAASESGIPVLMLLLKATLILLVALGITLSMQRASAGARHLVWLVTLATLLLVPALTAWGPIPLRILPAAATTAPRVSVENASTAPKTVAPKLDDAAATASTSKQFAARSLGSFVASSPVLTGISMLVLLWAAVVLAIAASLGYAAMLVKRIVNRARPLDSEDWMTPLWEVSDRLSLDEPPRLLRSEDAKMPFACGVFTPTIVLPAECDGWSLDRRRAVLLHELAHVRRHDLVGHTLGRVACAIYWFHPLVWKAAKQLRSESERACDDLALACGARATDYAEHLLDIVTSVRRDSTPSVALAMARRKEFEGRMLAILDPELRHSSPSRRQSAALIGSLAMISIVVGAAAPARRVQTAQSAVQAPVVKDADLAKNPVKAEKGYPDSREIIGGSEQYMSTRTSQTLSEQIAKSVSQHASTALGTPVSSAITSALTSAHALTMPRAH